MDGELFFAYSVKFKSSRQHTGTDTQEGRLLLLVNTKWTNYGVPADWFWQKPKHIARLTDAQFTKHLPVG